MLNGHDEPARERLAFGLNPALVGINRADQIMIDHLMHTHPQWKNIVELGTYTGVTALLLGMICRLRGGTLWTINLHDDRLAEVMDGWLPNMIQVFADIIPSSGPNLEVARIIHDAAPCLVIFDNGNKALEVRHYAEDVQPGSGIAVHDFSDDPNGHEVVWNDVKDVLGNASWVDLALTERQAWNSGFRCWLRV